MSRAYYYIVAVLAYCWLLINRYGTLFPRYYYLTPLLLIIVPLILDIIKSTKSFKGLSKEHDGLSKEHRSLENAITKGNDVIVHGMERKYDNLSVANAEMNKSVNSLDKNLFGLNEKMNSEIIHRQELNRASSAEMKDIQTSLNVLSTLNDVLKETQLQNLKLQQSISNLEISLKQERSKNAFLMKKAETLENQKNPPHPSCDDYDLEW